MKILVIEDDPDNIDLLRARLKHLDCEASFHETAEAGFEAALREKPEMILLDLKLGGELEKGIELVKRLRAEPVTATIPIYLHSIMVAHRSELPRDLEGVNGYLPKPFRFSDLKAIVEQVAAR